MELEVFWSYVAQAGLFVAGLTFEDLRALVSQLFWFLVVVAALGMLFKLNTIRDIIREFNKSRGPIWDLRETVNELKELEPVIRLLGEQMSMLDAKVDAARKQVTELQLESVSSRTTDTTQRFDQYATASASATSVNDDRNWETLRDYWRRNTERIEHTIEQIEDGRTRLAFDRMPRTNYKAIIDRLESTGRLNKAAANASRDLITEFNRYRPRSQKVPDAAIGPLQVLDQQLDREIVAHANIANAQGQPEAVRTRSLPQPPLPSEMPLPREIGPNEKISEHHAT